MPTVTVLTTAHLNHSPRDAIRIELIEDLEPLIVIHWPAKATMTPSRSGSLRSAATAARLFATAATGVGINQEPGGGCEA
mgnify:CR=1 FL=1